MKKMNNKGFSLIELIIVIAIMAVLVAVIAPNLTGYIGKSKQNTDKSNADTMENVLTNALQAFTTDTSMTFAGGTAETSSTAIANAADTYLLGSTTATFKIHTMNKFIDDCSKASKECFQKNVYDSLKKYVTETTSKAKEINPKVTSNKFYILIEGKYDDGYTCKVMSSKTVPQTVADFK